MDWLTPELRTTLGDKLQGDKERVGFVLRSGEVVECENISAEPARSFDVGLTHIERYHDEACATWHTHPGGSRLLSVGDYESFRAYPEFLHLIVAPDGIAAYRVEMNAVLNHPWPE